MTDQILAVILARKGSKGIPGKNMVQLAGKPLVAWSIEAAMKSKYARNLIVSSDCEKVLALASSYGVSCAIRPPSLATDDACSLQALNYLLLELLEKGQSYRYLILLQPTSPLRTANDIDDAFEKMSGCRAQSLISVKEPEESPLKAFVVNSDGYLNGAVNDEYPFMPRQKLPKTFYANGAIYIVEVEAFMKTNTFLTNKTCYFEMSKEKSIDIDTQEDLSKAIGYLS